MDTPQHRNAIAHHATWDQANGQGTSCDAMLFWPMPCHDRTSVSTRHQHSHEQHALQLAIPTDARGTHRAEPTMVRLVRTAAF